jgi:hypothetical protein
MSELEFYYHIRASLPPKPETPASLGAKFLQTLDALSRIDPAIFTNWQVMDLPAMAPFPIEEVRPYIAGIIETNVARDDWDNPTPEWGYTADAYTGDVVASRFIGLRIRAGGKDRGEISLESGNFKVFPDPAIVTYPVFKAALLALNSSWPPAWACAYAFSMDYDRTPLHPDEPLFPYSNFHIPWLAYLSAPLVADLIGAARHRDRAHARCRLSAYCQRATPRSKRYGTPAACAGVSGNFDRANRLSARRDH